MGEEVPRIPLLHLGSEKPFLHLLSQSDSSALCISQPKGATIIGPLCVPERGMTCLDVTQGISSDDTRGFPRYCQAPGFRVCINTRDTPVFDTATLSDLSTCCFITLLSNRSYFPLIVTMEQSHKSVNSIALPWQLRKLLEGERWSF